MFSLWPTVLSFQRGESSQGLESFRSCMACFPRCRKKWPCKQHEVLPVALKQGTPWTQCLPLQNHRGSLSDGPHHGKWLLCRYPQGGQNTEWWQYHVGDFADLWYAQQNCCNVLYSFGIINKTKGLGLPGTWPCRLCSCVCGVPKLTPEQCCC